MRAPLAVCLLTLLQAPSWSAETDQIPRYTLQQPEPSTGTNIKKEVAAGGVPFDKRYGELTPEQQGRLKAQYESMGPNDEPPFPANGLGPIYKAIAAAQQRLMIEGAFSAEVEVNSLGQAVSVSVLQSSNPKMTQFVAAVLMKEAYKPALCGGSPCKMQFPFRMQFKTSF